MLIVFEGIDGSGKTTLSLMLKKKLEKRGYPTEWFREPGDSKWGQKIRNLAVLQDKIPIKEELKYFIEDRKINVRDNILPALEANKIVIQDRYFFSTACYQGARGLDMEKILVLNREFAPEPDIAIIVDVDVDTSLKRIKLNRSGTVRLFEKREFLQSVRNNYLKLRGEHIHIVDGTKKIETVFYSIKQLPKIGELLEQPFTGR